MTVHGRCRTIHGGWGHPTHVRWDIGRASLSMVRIKGQSAHVKLISHVGLVGCFSVKEFKLSVSDLNSCLRWD